MKKENSYEILEATKLEFNTLFDKNLKNDNEKENAKLLKL